MSGSKRCFRCKEEQPISEYFKDVRKKDGHQNTCKSCKTGHYEDRKYKWVARLMRNWTRACHEPRQGV